jgi:hypothetical protein
MKKFNFQLAILFCGLIFGNGSIGAQAGGQSAADDHHKGVNSRGDHAMGFSHEKTTHHFRLRDNGGVIEVTANDAADVASRDQIRRHLRHIALKFKQGDFDAPAFIHDKEPPGVSTMKRLSERIEYRCDEIENGARVVISSNDREAVAAVHEFLRFQIADHRTGDSGKIER